MRSFYPILGGKDHRFSILCSFKLVISYIILDHSYTDSFTGMTKGLWCLAGGKNKQLTDVGRLGRDRNRNPLHSDVKGFVKWNWSLRNLNLLNTNGKSMRDSGYSQINTFSGAKTDPKSSCPPLHLLFFFPCSITHSFTEMCWMKLKTLTLFQIWSSEWLHELLQCKWSARMKGQDGAGTWAI